MADCFEEVKKNFGFGCMRLPMNGKEVDYEETSKMVDAFLASGFHYFDTAKLLDQLGVAVRSGHHCAQPLLAHFGLTGAVRATPAFYNTKEEIDALAAGLDRIAALTGGTRA